MPPDETARTALSSEPATYGVRRDIAYGVVAALVLVGAYANNLADLVRWLRLRCGRLWYRRRSGLLWCHVRNSLRNGICLGC